MGIKNSLTRLRYDPRQERLARHRFFRNTAIPKLERVGVINNLKELIRYVEGLPGEYPKMRQAMENDLNFLKALSRSEFQRKNSRGARISRDRDITLKICAYIDLSS